MHTNCIYMFCQVALCLDDKELVYNPKNRQVHNPQFFTSQLSQSTTFPKSKGFQGGYFQGPVPIGSHRLPIGTPSAWHSVRCFRSLWPLRSYYRVKVAKYLGCPGQVATTATAKMVSFCGTNTGHVQAPLKTPSGTIQLVGSPLLQWSYHLIHM